MHIFFLFCRHFSTSQYLSFLFDKSKMLVWSWKCQKVFKLCLLHASRRSNFKSCFKSGKIYHIKKNPGKKLSYYINFYFLFWLCIWMQILVDYIHCIKILQSLPSVIPPNTSDIADHSIDNLSFMRNVFFACVPLTKLTLQFMFLLCYEDRSRSFFRFNTRA